MADFWKFAGLAPCITVIGWLLLPVITFLANKLMTKISACLVDATSKKLRELEFQTVPDLEQTLRDAEEKSKKIAEEDETSESLERLDKMRKDLQSALYEAEDILDLVDYHRIQEDVRRDGNSHGSIWVKQLHDAARCLPAVTVFTEGIQVVSLVLLVCMVAIAVLLRRSMGAIESLCRRFRGAFPWRSGAEAGPAPVNSDADQADIEIAIPEALYTPVSGPISIADDIQYSTMKCVHWFQWRFMDISSFCLPMRTGLANAVTWVHFFWDWLTNVVVIFRSYRDWSYDQVGVDIMQVLRIRST